MPDGGGGVVAVAVVAVAAVVASVAAAAAAALVAVVVIVVAVVVAVVAVVAVIQGMHCRLLKGRRCTSKCGGRSRGIAGTTGIFSTVFIRGGRR